MVAQGFFLSDYTLLVRLEHEAGLIHLHQLAAGDTGFLLAEIAQTCAMDGATGLALWLDGLRVGEFFWQLHQRFTRGGECFIPSAKGADLNPPAIGNAGGRT